MGDQEEPWEATQLQALTQSQTQSQGQGQTSSQAQPWVRYCEWPESSRTHVQGQCVFL